MAKEKIREKYFKLKGQFSEIMDLLDESGALTISLAVCFRESSVVIRFDNFKMSFDEKFQEINLDLYYGSQEMASFNLVNNYNFQFDFDDLCIDFKEDEAC